MLAGIFFNFYSYIRPSRMPRVMHQLVDIHGAALVHLLITIVCGSQAPNFGLIEFESLEA